MVAMALACGVTSAKDSTTPEVNIDGVTVDSFRIVRNGEYMTVDMALGLKNLKVSSNKAVLLTPRLVNGNDSIDLTAIGIYGRRRYYTYVRNGKSMLSGDDEKSFMASKKPDELAYRANVDYAGWMDGAVLRLDRQEYGCCNSLLASQHAVLGNYAAPQPVAKTVEFFPELVYVNPKAELTKSRSLKGSAYIDFPVDKTAIFPDYRRNTVELGKIRATIDSVRNDRDVTITQVWLKGYASPESPYAHNRDLAIGRTASLKNYIQKLYHFDGTVITTDYEPEDWAGLRRRVEQSDISHRQEILDIIDNDREPDAKEWIIKSTYPAEYRFMLENFYPALRHTDYRIAYNIRGFSDVDEIESIMKTQPQKLSLNEFYLVAQKYEPGSEAFTDVFETAVHIFPNDEIANLNAANAEMRRGDNARARRYLDKAGDSPEAAYARGALAIREGDYATARRYLSDASKRGIAQADKTLEALPLKK